MRATVKELQEYKYRLMSLPLFKVFDSSQIKALAYDADLRMLVVYFTYSNAIYAYANVLQDFFTQLCYAPSKGQFLAQRIKAHPDLFPYLRLQ